MLPSPCTQRRGERCAVEPRQYIVYCTSFLFCTGSYHAIIVYVQAPYERTTWRTAQPCTSASCQPVCVTRLISSLRMYFGRAAAIELNTAHRIKSNMYMCTCSWMQQARSCKHEVPCMHVYSILARFGYAMCYCRSHVVLTVVRTSRSVMTRTG
jgi:hypothetical protein